MFYKFNRCRQRAKEILNEPLTYSARILAQYFKSLKRDHSTLTTINVCSVDFRWSWIEWVGFLKSERITSFFTLCCLYYESCDLPQFTFNQHWIFVHIFMWVECLDHLFYLCIEFFPKVHFFNWIIFSWYLKMANYMTMELLNGFRVSIEYENRVQKWIVHLSHVELSCLVVIVTKIMK